MSTSLPANALKLSWSSFRNILPGISCFQHCPLDLVYPYMQEKNPYGPKCFISNRTSKTRLLIGQKCLIWVSGASTTAYICTEATPSAHWEMSIIYFQCHLTASRGYFQWGLTANHFLLEQDVLQLLLFTQAMEELPICLPLLMYTHRLLCQ